MFSIKKHKTLQYLDLCFSFMSRYVLNGSDSQSISIKTLLLSILHHNIFVKNRFDLRNFSYQNNLRVSLETPCSHLSGKNIMNIASFDTELFQNIVC